MSNEETTLMDSSDGDRLLPLSSAQMDFWLLQSFNKDAQPRLFEIAEYLQFNGVINVTLFEQALRRCVDEILAYQLSVVMTAQGPRQRFALDRGWPFPIIDLTRQSDPQGAALAWMERDLNQPLDVQQGPLFSFALLQCSKACFYFYHKCHHIMTDGYGGHLFTQRLGEIYSGLLAKQPPPQSCFTHPLSIFKHNRAYESASRFERDRYYWSNLLANKPEAVNLSGTPHRVCKASSRAIASLPQQVSEGLRAFAEAMGTTMANLLTTLIAIYLHKMSGQDDMLLGLTVAGRIGKVLRRFPGMASSSVPLCLGLTAKMTLAEACQVTQNQVYSAIRHQAYPLQALRIDQGLNHTSDKLYSTIINILPFAYDDINFAGLVPEVQNLSYGCPEGLNIAIGDRGAKGGLECCLDGDSALYSEASLRAHLQRLTHLLCGVSQDPAQQIAELDIVLPEEYQLFAQWNQTQQAYPKDTCIHQLFERQVEQTPEAIALVFAEQTLSYQQLNQQANQLAHYLLEQGVTPDSLVGLCMERSLEMMIGILGILKAGAAYVPLDPSYPQARLDYMREDTQLNIVVTQQRHATCFPMIEGHAPITILCLDESGLRKELASYSPINIDAQQIGLCSDHLAYVIYTSGTTGKPKGCLLRHQGLVNCTLAQITQLEIQASSRVLQFASLAFDASLWEWGAALCQGATLVILQEKDSRDPKALCEQVAYHGVSHATLPPALLAVLEPALMVSLKVLVVAGEACSLQEAQRWSAGRLFINAYGPTEATICSSIKRYDKGVDRLLLGRPLVNVQHYVVDRHDQQVPIGVAGELLIGGVGLARGYLHQSALTAQRFIANPFYGQNPADSSQRLYRTGDLVRYRDNGELDYLGRMDDQVKVRGFRIELGEIESQLRQYQAVQEAAVWLQTPQGKATAVPSVATEKALVAYLVAKKGQTIDEHKLRAWLTAQLPDYMIPAYFIRLDELPLTVNGKLDRQALPKPQASTLAQDHYEAPIGKTEEMLADIWQRLLKVERVGRQDNFFHLGGHSLLAVHLATQVQQRLLRELPLSALFERPQLSALAQYLDTSQLTTPALME